MNEVELWQQLSNAIPARLRTRVLWVFQHKYWDKIEVGFAVGNGNVKSVVIPKSDWLNDAAIARLCLEAP